MSVSAKRILLCVIGALAGAASFPFTETAVYFQEFFPSYLIFSVSVGVIFGLFVGSFFSTSEGIFLHDSKKILKGFMLGALIGSIGGAAGFLAGQFILFFLGQIILQGSKDIEIIGLPAARAASWAILGVFIGITEGIRSGSMKKIITGFFGGIAGGASGGVIFEILKYLLKDAFFSRLTGLIIFGFLIGFFYGLIERKLASGKLRVLNGTLRGKELLINQKKIRIGEAAGNDFVLKDYYDIDPHHALIKQKKDELTIKNISKNKVIKINDEPASESVLKFGDVIKIGEAKFLYKLN